MRLWLAIQLERLANWLAPPVPAPETVIVVPHLGLFIDAQRITRMVEVEKDHGDATGERRRRLAFALLKKTCPGASWRQISVAIEAAIQEMN